MITQGNFKYFYNNESKTYEEMKDLLSEGIGCTIEGLNIYFSPKKVKEDYNHTTVKVNTSPENRLKIHRLLEIVEQHQKQNGGILQGEEFPFDSIPKEQKSNNPPPHVKSDTPEHWEVYADMIMGKFNTESVFTVESFNIDTDINGIKETENKVDYGELDFDYIDGMALRMTKNLSKYPPKNWQKNINIKELAKSAMRHARKILQEIDNDEETLQDHAIALGNNGMMINFQLKNLHNKK